MMGGASSKVPLRKVKPPVHVSCRFCSLRGLILMVWVMEDASSWTAVRRSPGSGLTVGAGTKSRSQLKTKVASITSQYKLTGFRMDLYIYSGVDRTSRQTDRQWERDTKRRIVEKGEVNEERNEKPI